MDFIEARRKKIRGMSNEEFLTEYHARFVESEALVVVSFDKNKNICTFQTVDSQLTSLGMLEVAKQQILDSMEND